MVTTRDKIQAKSKDRGTPMIYVGPAFDHAADVHRFLNPATKRVIQSRDVSWLGQTYGEWKGLKDPLSDEPVMRLPTEEVQSDDSSDESIDFIPCDDAPAPTVAARPPTPAARVMRAMRQLDSSFNPEARDYIRMHAQDDDQPAGREEQGQATMEDDEWYSNLTQLTMLDGIPFGVSFSAFAADELAMSATCNLKPEQYKDNFSKPATFDEAWNHPDPFQREKWREAIMLEFSKMDQRGMWKKVSLAQKPKDRRMIKCKWVFEIKRDGRFRARLVACGYSQVGGMDFNLVYSPVVNDVTFRILLIALMVWDLSSRVFDVETAFLLGDLEEEIYMQMPKGMKTDGQECLLLLKSMYGLVQSGRQWYKMWSSIMSKLGFSKSPADPCLFKRGKGSSLLLVCLYVDDGIAIGKDAELDKFFAELQGQVKITMEETMDDYLSCSIKMNPNQDQGMARATTHGEEVGENFW